MQVHRRERVHRHVVRQEIPHAPVGELQLVIPLVISPVKLPRHRAARGIIFRSFGNTVWPSHRGKVLADHTALERHVVPPPLEPCSHGGSNSNGNVWIRLSASPPCVFPDRLPPTNAPCVVAIS
jgi:hypothetical protein